MDDIKRLRRLLEQRDYAQKTINGTCNKTQRFKDWCGANGIDPKRANLEQLYQYKRHHLERGVRPKTAQDYLVVLAHYYQAIGRRDNPALLVRYEKGLKSLPDRLLEKTELLELYRLGVAKTLLQKRDRVILGLVIFQGLRQAELKQLELHFVDMERATVYVPATRTSNSRTLPLDPVQMLELGRYVYELRPKLLTEAKKETNHLFFSMYPNTTNSLNNLFINKCRELRALSPAFRDPTQLRESRFAIWVEQHGLRKAQYMAGIKYVSSMLRYKRSDVKQLGQKLGIVHPMEKY